MLESNQNQIKTNENTNSNGNDELLGLYDSSNKLDPKDSKTTAGHVIMFAGGPISWQCKKAAHVGASSSHNEYMAAFRMSLISMEI